MGRRNFEKSSERGAGVNRHLRNVLGRERHQRHALWHQPLIYKVKRQYLLNCKVRRYCLLALHSRTDLSRLRQAKANSSNCLLAKWALTSICCHAKANNSNCVFQKWAVLFYSSAKQIHSTQLISREACVHCLYQKYTIPPLPRQTAVGPNW